MKNLKFLFLALVIVALLVAGLSVTVFASDVAEDTAITVDGDEYTVEDAEEMEIEDEQEVVVYLPGFVHYNPNASYTIAEGCEAEVALITELEEDWLIINFMTWADLATASYNAGDTVLVYDAVIGADYKSDLTYDAGEGSNFDYAFINLQTNKINFKSFGDNATNLKNDLYGSGITTKGSALKLFSDCIVPRGRDVNDNNSEDGYWCSGAAGTEDDLFSTYLDLNGKTLAFITAESKATFYLYNKSNRAMYIFSSKPNGVIANVGNKSNPTAGALLGGYTENFHAYFGTVEFGGKINDGNNLSVYAGSLVMETSKGGSVNIDGGYYCNPTATNTSGLVRDRVFDKIRISNAKIYTAGGMFVNFTTTPDAVIENCDLYTDWDNGSGYVSTIAVSQSSTGNVTIKDCRFIVPEGKTGINTIVVGGSSYTQSTATVVFDNCLVTKDPRITTAKHSPDFIQALPAPLAAKYTFKIPTLTCNEATDGFTFTNHVIDYEFDRIMTDVVFHHSITLASDLVYNIFVPIGATNITVNGDPVTSKSYNSVYDMVQVVVPAKNAADEITLSCTYANNTHTVTTSVLSYVNKALGLYPDDTKLVTLLNAVKDYAKAAADYANYNGQGFDYSYSQNLTTEENSGVAMEEVSNEFKAVIKGATLRLDGKIAFVFAVAENATGDVALKYSYGKKIINETVTVDGETEIVVYVKACDLNNDISITVGSETLKYSLKNYIYDMSSGENKTDEKLMALLAYINNYSYTANLYLCPAHVGGIAQKENVVLKTDTTHGSYDMVISCVNCGYEMERMQVLDRAPLGDFIVEANGEGTYKLLGIRDKSMTSIVIPDSITEIAEGAFNGCSSLVSLDIPFVGAVGGAREASYATLFGYIFGTTEFAGASATAQTYAYTATSNTYYIPDSLIKVTVRGGGEIYYGAFNGCKKIETIILGNGVTRLGTSFYNMGVCKAIVIPTSVTSIPGNSTFKFGSDESIFYMGSRFDKNGEQTAISKRLEAQEEDSATVTLPVYYYSETQPTDDGNYWHYNGDEIEIWLTPYETTKLADFTWTKKNGTYTITGVINTSATTLNIPDRVSAISTTAAFASCASLQSFTVDEGSAYYKAMDGILFNAAGTSLVAYPNAKAGTSYTVPAGVTTIASSAFYSNENLVDVVIPDSVTTLGDRAFYGAKKLANVTIGSGVRVLNTYTFGQCPRLAKVVIAEGLTTLSGTYIFYNSGNANTIIVLPKSITTIGSAAFQLAKGKVFFAGTSADWINKFGNYADKPATAPHVNGNELDPYDGANNKLNTSAIVYYYSAEEPTDAGLFWHYENEVPTAWPVKE